MQVPACLVILGAAMALLVSVGCSDAQNARRQIRQVHVSALRATIRQDEARHLAGVEQAARRLAPGFVLEDPSTRQRQLRIALGRLQEPPRGVEQFITSPMSFLAAVGPDGLVIARDTPQLEDKMRGKDFKSRYPVVRAALDDGRAGYALGEFPGEGDADSSWSMMFVHPVRHEDKVVGAVVAGIPLWRMAQRLGRQLQVEHASEQGLILWVYLYKGDRLFHFGTPPDLDQVVPGAAERAQGLSSSPSGFTGQVQQFGRWYGWGVFPAPGIGEDVGMVIFRSDPD